MTWEIIASGSSGNAVVIDGCILIDCGVSWAQLTSVVPEIRVVLLTHIHGDHFRESTVRRLARERPTVRFAGGPWMMGALRSLGIPWRSIDCLSAGHTYRYGGDGYYVTPYELFHDVPNYGWLIRRGESRIFYAVDTFSLDGISVQADVYLVEGNHREAEIRERIREKQERGEFSYEVRAARTHMSVERATAWFHDVAPEGAQLVLMHRHKDN